jgi:hypothetical protein
VWTGFFLFSTPHDQCNRECINYQVEMNEMNSFWQIYQFISLICNYGLHWFAMMMMGFSRVLLCMFQDSRSFITSFSYWVFLVNFAYWVFYVFFTEILISRWYNFTILSQNLEQKIPNNKISKCEISKKKINKN